MSFFALIVFIVIILLLLNLRLLPLLGLALVSNRCLRCVLFRRLLHFLSLVL